MIAFVINLLARLPLWWLYRLSDFFYLILYYLIGYRKKVVMANLDRAFPERSIQEKKRIAKDFYLDFCDFLVETVKSFQISKEEVIRRTRPTQKTQEILKKHAKSGESFLILVTHHMNWEWVSQACSAEADIQVAPIYKPLHNKKIDQLIFQMRSRFGATPIPMKETQRRLLQKNNPATTYVLVADQTPAKRNRQYWTKFFGREVPFFTGVAHLAPKSNLPVYFLRISKVKRGYYEYAAEEIKRPPYSSDPDLSIIDIFSAKAEAAIIHSPRNWLWTHRRWKRVKENQN